MTVYAQYTVSNQFVPANKTRSGYQDHNHVISGRKEGDERPVAIKCDECEPYLLREGWYRSAAMVPLTEDQVERKADLEHEAGLAMRQAGQYLAEAATSIAASRPVETSKYGLTAEQYEALRAEIRAEDAVEPEFASRPVPVRRTRRTKAQMAAARATA